MWIIVALVHPDSAAYRGRPLVHLQLCGTLFKFATEFGY